MKRTLVAVAVMTALCSGGALAQATRSRSPPKGRGPESRCRPPPAATEKQLYSQGQFDFLLKERLAQGGQDTPEIRNAVREELNTRELLAREAKKQGVDKNADVKTQMDLASQTVLVRAYVTDWVKKNPVPEADLKKEYDAIKGQIGDKEYKVRHILVEKEDEAKEIVDRAAEGREVRRAREGALEGSRLEGQGRRPRLERAGEFREAVRRRDEGDAQGQVHGAAGADAVRLARDRGRRRPRRQGAGLRRGEAAAAAAHAGAVARQVLQGSAREERHVIRRRARCNRGQAETACLFFASSGGLRCYPTRRAALVLFMPHASRVAGADR